MHSRTADLGSRSDSFDNPVAGSIVRLHKTELFYPGDPWIRLEDQELATLGWVW